MNKKPSDFGSNEGGFGSQNQFQQNPYLQQQNFFGQQFNPMQYPQVCHGLAYDIYEDAENLIVEIPFPGLIRDSLSIFQESPWLRVRGETQLPIPAESANKSQRTFLLNQIPKGVFDQTIFIPYEIEPTHSKASYTNGVLTITIKKAISKQTVNISTSFQ